jgi:sec-independent protein translocase protein TatA
MFELFQPTHLLFVLLVALVVFGPKRLMEISRSLGQTVRSLQEYKEEFKAELSTSAKEKNEETTGKDAGTELAKERR